MSHECSVYCLHIVLFIFYDISVCCGTANSFFTVDQTFNFTFILCWDDLDSCWWLRMRGLLSYWNWPDPCSCSFWCHLHGYIKFLWVEGDAVDGEQLEGKHWRGAHFLWCLTEKRQVKEHCRDYKLQNWEWTGKPENGVQVAQIFLGLRTDFVMEFSLVHCKNKH